MRHAFVPMWIVCTALAGCQANYAYRQQGNQAVLAPGASSVTSSVDLKLGGALASERLAGAIVVSVMLADGVRYYLRLPDGTRMPYYGVPQADPARRINVQDCTQPIDIKAGNLMCR
jgi:hypothetical protein